MKRPVEPEVIPEVPEPSDKSNERTIPDIQPRKHRRVTAEANALGSFGKIQRKQRRISGNTSGVTSGCLISVFRYSRCKTNIANKASWKS